MEELAIPESLAVAIFTAAINEGRAAELLLALFEGGSATVDMYTRKLVIAPASAFE